MEYRQQKDSLGEVRIPADAPWGPQTQRAVDNFAISGYRIPGHMREALGLIKACAAAANASLGLLDGAAAAAIEAVGMTIWRGGYSEAFPVEVFQTGSGTSWNMNANEVIARLAAEESGLTLHPNDHVNLCQSSNDVIPTALNIATMTALEELLREIAELRDAARAKGSEFADIIKLGRTHLQDAVPVRLGDGFRGTAEQLNQAIEVLQAVQPQLLRLALGGTAVGSGLNAHPEFAGRAVDRVAAISGFRFYTAAVPGAEMNSRLPQVALMGAVQSLAVTLQRWSIDLRLQSSGPNGGLGELNLPELQPGSSIMPGKINPVIPEAVQQTAVHVLAKNQAVATAAAQGPLELNIMFPLIAWESLESLRLLANACASLRLQCVQGITANATVCRTQVESSLALITRVAADIGYDKAAKIALRAQRSGMTLREVLMQDEGYSEAECERVLDPAAMLPDNG